VATPQHEDEPPREFPGTRTINAAWRCVLMGYPAWWLEVPAETLARVRPAYAAKPGKLERWWNKEGIKMTGNAQVPQCVAAVMGGVYEAMEVV
jgi:hypothetical protein